MSSSSPPLSGDGDGISDKITRSILDAHGAPDSWERRGSPGSPVFCESLVRVFLFFPRFLEQVAGSHVSLVGWRPSLVGWRPSLVETQKDMVFDATCYMLLHLPGQVGGFGLSASEHRHEKSPGRVGLRWHVHLQDGGHHPSDEATKQQLARPSLVGSGAGVQTFSGRTSFGRENQALGSASS